MQMIASYAVALCAFALCLESKVVCWLIFNGLKVCPILYTVVLSEYFALLMLYRVVLDEYFVISRLYWVVVNLILGSLYSLYCLLDLIFCCLE